jgi:hypothetical protein
VDSHAQRISPHDVANRSLVKLPWLVGAARKARRSKSVPKEVLHRITVHGLRLEFRAPGPGRSVGSIACFGEDGVKQTEIFTTFDTLESIIEGIVLLRTRMRDLTVTQDLGPPLKR